MSPPAYLTGSAASGIPSYCSADPKCTGKVRFESAVIGARAAKRRGGRISYRCESCGGFHVGTDTIEPIRNVRQSLIVRESESVK